MLDWCHYKVVKQELKSDPSMMQYEALVRPYDTIKPLHDEELKKVEEKKRNNQATEEDKLQTQWAYFCWSPVVTLIN